MPAFFSVSSIFTFFFFFFILSILDYWFELKDEPWKQDPTVPVEPYWGIFDKDGKLKIKIPDCIAP